MRLIHGSGIGMGRPQSLHRIGARKSDAENSSQNGLVFREKIMVYLETSTSYASPRPHTSTTTPTCTGRNFDTLILKRSPSPNRPKIRSIFDALSSSPICPCLMEMPVKEWIAVLNAADAAARWHVHQRRKGAAREPYVNHLLEVASLVADATEGKDPELVIAALLHDAIEDQEVPREMIAELWGEAVAAIVEEVTDDKEMPKAARKRKQVESASTKSPKAKLIKLADKTSNLRAITGSPSPEWSVKRRLEYVKWARDVVDGLRGTNSWLEGEFDKAAQAADVSVRPHIKKIPKIIESEFVVTRNQQRRNK